jgi:fructoselysine-6-P-deglycase FrlB-like protein
MTNYQTVRSNEDIYKAKAEVRRMRAAEPFERKLLALVRMQMMDYSIARSAGRTARKPWHSEDKNRVKIYASFQG